MNEKTAPQLPTIHAKLQPISHEDEGSPEIGMGERSLRLGCVAFCGALGARFVPCGFSVDELDLRLAREFSISTKCRCP